MGLFNTLNTGASGLTASGVGLSVIGDNIANMNTTGFKRSRASFADAIPGGIGTLGGSSQLGTGVVTGGMNREFEQGSLIGSGSALNVALQGEGWFAVNDGGQQYFTRDGNFGLDEQGWLVNGQGLRVQGYGAQQGVLSPVVADVQVDLGPVPPVTSTQITLDAVLSSQDFDPLQVDYTVQLLDGASETVADASQRADFSTSITVYDSLGRAHDVVLNFEQQSEGATGTSWAWSAIIDAGETDLAGSSPGMAYEMANGTLDFDTDGALTAFTQIDAIGWTFPGSAPMTLELDVGLDAAGNPTDGSLSAYGSDDALRSIQQDGSPIGDLAGISVDVDGVLRGTYTNGVERDLGALAIATFSAESGLEGVGGNLFSASQGSGEAALGMAGTGTRGTTTGYALEGSNVDLEDEFVRMIRVQRSYQANAGVVRTADETLQELVNLV